MEIHLNKKIQVIELFYNRVVYTKDERGFQNHNHSKFQWPKSIVSDAGYIENQSVMLPISKLQDQVEGYDILALTNYHSGFDTRHRGLLHEQGYLDDRNTLVGVHFLKRKQGQLKFGILHFGLDDPLSVYLNYSTWGVGIPKRESFLITKLKERSKARIRINGKHDFSMASRKERIFIEQDILLNYIGTFQNLHLVEDNKTSKTKFIRLDEYKDIDLRKTLY